MSTPPTEPTARRYALAVLCAGMLMTILDGSIVTVALPAIGHDLGFTPSSLAWTVNAYMIAFGGLLLLAGRLADLLGRRRTFITGLLLFTAASTLCGLADSPGQLVAGRFVQGIGAAISSAASLGMIVALFPEPPQRARALGAFAFTGAAGAAIGQVAGGLITDTLGWHWIFLINLPIGLVAAALGLRVLTPDRGVGLARGADVPGAALATTGLALTIYTIVGTDTHRWASTHTLGLGALAAVLLGAFLLRQHTAARPLLPLRVFRSRATSGANAAQVLIVGAMAAFQFMVSLYLQDVLGYDATQTGIALLPAAVTIAVMSLGFSPVLIGRFGERAVLLAGVAALAAGMAWLTRIPVDGRYLTDLLPTMLATAGFGMVLPALTALAMSAATAQDAGVASGVFTTSQTLGGALGLAAINTLASSRVAHLLGSGEPTRSAMTGGFRLGFGVATGLLVAALILTAVVLRPPRSRPPATWPRHETTGTGGGPARPFGHPAATRPGR